MRIGLSLYGGEGGKVSGLLNYQRRWSLLARERGWSVVPFSFGGGGVGLELRMARAARRFFLKQEGLENGLEYPRASELLVEGILRLFDREKLDALHIVEWMPVGMALWEAALRWGGPTVFTPTEHGAVCQYAFLLHNRGGTCNGPGQGDKCARCTHGLEPFPVEESAEPWYSRRHQMFHQSVAFLPGVMQRRALWVLSACLQKPGAVVSVAEARARVASARRFLRKVSAVAFQSATQHRVFEEALGVPIPSRLPMVVPIQDFGAGEAKVINGGTRPIVYAFAARPHFDRGLWQLLDAWRIWNPAPSQAVLRVYTHSCDDVVERRLQALRQMGSDVGVVFGVLGDEGLRMLHRESHFVVNPVVWREPGSSTVIEGFGFGTPAIVPCRTGSADIVEEGRNGYLFEFRDAASLASTMKRAADGMGSWEGLSTGARESALAYQERVEGYFRELGEVLGADK